MTRPAWLISCLLLSAAASPAAFGMGNWPEPAINEEIKETMTSAEGTVTALNLESDPPIIQVTVKSTGRKLVLMMNKKTTAVWIDEKLKRIRHLKFGDGVRVFYVKHEGRGMVTGIEVLSRAPPSKGAAPPSLQDDLKSLQKRQPAVKTPPNPAVGIQNTPLPAPIMQKAPAAAPVRPPMPVPVTSTQERRPVR